MEYVENVQFGDQKLFLYSEVKIYIFAVKFDIFFSQPLVDFQATALATAQPINITSDQQKGF